MNQFKIERGLLIGYNICIPVNQIQGFTPDFSFKRTKKHINMVCYFSLFLINAVEIEVKYRAMDNSNYDQCQKEFNEISDFLKSILIENYKTEK